MMEDRNGLDATDGRDLANGNRNLPNGLDFMKGRDLMNDRDGHLMNGRDMTNGRYLINGRDLFNSRNQMNDRNLTNDRDMTNGRDMINGNDILDGRGIAEDRSPSMYMMENRNVHHHTPKMNGNGIQNDGSRPVSLYDNFSRENDGTLERRLGNNVNGNASAQANFHRDITPSLTYCLTTTVPQNIKATNIAGKHAPTRNSLRHSRMIVMNRIGQGNYLI